MGETIDGDTRTEVRMALYETVIKNPQKTTTARLRIFPKQLMFKVTISRQKSVEMVKDTAAINLLD